MLEVWSVTGAIIVVLGAMQMMRTASKKCHHKWETLSYRIVDVWASPPGRYPQHRRSDLTQACERCGEPRVLSLKGVWDPTGELELK